LVRPRDGCTAFERLQQRYRRGGGNEPGPTVEAIAGDITAPDWQLDHDDLAAVIRDTDVIIHSAADTSFAARRDTSRTNVASAKILIDLARKCKRTPLIVYIGTAANVGRAEHCCLAEDQGCQTANDHFNEYTHSKAVAEQLLRDSGLPALVVRPSIVLGAGLPDADFAKQILWCVPLTRFFRGLPIDPSARLDIVDVEFVADATLALLRRADRRHDCYHLSAGLSHSVTIEQLRVLVDPFYRRKHPLRLFTAGDWTREVHRTFVRTSMQRRVFRSLRHYLPFLNMDVVYDDLRLRSELGPRTPQIRPTLEYFTDLLRLIRPRAALREAAMP
jgi:nucleoside-diphosphate-sugar epimerase